MTPTSSVNTSAFANVDCIVIELGYAYDDISVLLLLSLLSVVSDRGIHTDLKLR